MWGRCINENHRFYANYGGRGITVCSKWKTFAGFLEDMGERPFCMELDRIDNNGNYCKENCRWVSPKEQSRNKRNNRLIEYKGETRCLVEWAEIIGIRRETLSRRLHLGWSIEKAFTTNVGDSYPDRSGANNGCAKFTDTKLAKVGKLLDSGLTIKAVSRELGVCANTIYNWRKKYLWECKA